jgi:23S rRNA A2030 N6-methylase RlmJ
VKFRDLLDEKYMPYEWWEKQATITLYHGTTWENAKQIKKEGLKLLNAKETVNRLLKQFNLDIKKVPDWILGEISLRPENRIYMTNKKEQAINYAKHMSIFGGEVATSTVYRILKHQGKSDEEIDKILKPKKLKHAIVTIDMPWKEAKTYRNLNKTLLQIKKRLGDDWKKELQNPESLYYYGFEFYSEKPIPKKYIMRIDKI